MAIALLTAHNTPVVGTATSITLPAAIPANSWAYLFAITQVSSVLTLPAGWLLVDSGSTTSNFTSLYVKPVGVADSSAVVNIAMGTSARINVGVVIASGENLDVLAAVQLTATASATTNVSAITPTKADCVDLVIGCLGGLTGGGTPTVTPSAGFTEDMDFGSAFGSAVDLVVYAEHRQLSGQAGVAQAATTLTTNITCRSVMWRLSLAPGAGTERIRDARLSVQALTRAQSSRMRNARLSMQVLVKTRPGPPPFVGWGVPL